MTVDVEQFAARLKARRDFLNRALHRIEDTLDQPPSQDFEERATEREGDEVMESLGNLELAEVHQIDAALKRIEAGTFGVCSGCGDEISDERLNAVPHAARCRKCA